MQTLHFIAGLPRAGSTMLTSLLGQNPRIHGAPISGLCGAVISTHVNWDTNEFHVETPNPEAKRRILRTMLDTYHATSNKPLVVDKNRQWLANVELIETILERPMKIIVLVRPIVEVLASFEHLRKKQILTVTLADAAHGVGSTLEMRAEGYCSPQGVIGSANNHIKDAVASGFLDRLLFVDYNKLTATPQKQLKRIYDFIEEPQYRKHDFSKIIRPGESDTRIHKFAGLHDIRPTLKKESPDPLTTLGEEVFKKYHRKEPWNGWI